MSVRYACDGCGEMLPEGTKPTIVGTVLKREYCEPCGAVARQYVAEVSTAHTVTAQMWQEKLDAIRAKYTNMEFDEHVGLKLLPDTSA